MPTDIGGQLCVLAIIALAIFLLVLDRRRAAEEARILREGVTVLGWVVMANNELYTGTHVRAYSNAQIVFTPLADLPDLEGTMRNWARKLQTYQPPETPTQEERIIASVMRTHIPYSKPLRLPDAITEGVEGYTYSIRVPFLKLPEGKLTRPYIFCKFLPGEAPKVLMIDYPAGTS